MVDEPAVDLSFIAAQLRQVSDDLAAMRDDLRVLTAIAMRKDRTLAALLTEVRAMHAQHDCMDGRLRAPEARMS